MSRYVTEDDYVVIGKTALDVIQQSTEEKRLLAEETAREEVAGYLRDRYDVERIFTARGTERNQKVVSCYCDIVLYHLVSWLPNRMGYEIREKRYERALEWLARVQAGKIVPQLPGYDPQGEQPGGAAGVTHYGGGRKNTFNW